MESVLLLFRRTIAAIFLVPSWVQAAAPAASLDAPPATYARQFVTDAGTTLSAPLRWQTSDWRNAALLGGVGVALYRLDGQTRAFAQSSRNDATDTVARFVEPFGNGIGATALPIGVYLLGQMSGRHSLKTAGALALESVVLASTFSGTLKFVVQRHRPETGDAYTSADGPTFPAQNFSFPSGHTTAAFALATTFAELYPGTPIPVTAYAIATLTGLSRINDNKHWGSDVFAGAVIGFHTAKIVVRSHRNRRLAGLRWQPVIRGDAVAIAGILQY